MKETTLRDDRTRIVKLTAEQISGILRLQSAYGCPIDDTNLQFIHANLQDAIDSGDLGAIQKLSNILRECIEYKKEGNVRKKEDISHAEEQLADFVWYDRILLDDENYPADPGKRDRRAIEERYQKADLGPYTDFQWGKLIGKLSALRWVLGFDWDMLDD